MADAFKPTLSRLLIALLVAIVGFALPQGVPLEWTALNDPGDDILCLEITCASDKAGDVQIFYDAGRGVNELESIRWPITPTTRAYTYTFPLPDAPIRELRLDPVAQGGTLTIQQLRIINRRGEERRRLTVDAFSAVQEIASIAPAPDGWTVTSTPASRDPFTRVQLGAPIVPVGMNGRNLHRCLLSSAYLALMLAVILLAALFSYHRPAGRSDVMARVGFVVFLAICFSLVANRGLIRQTLRIRQFHPPPPPTAATLELDLTSTRPDTPAQLFWDVGHGFTETDSARQPFAHHANLQTLRFPLPAARINALRLDPQDGEGTVTIRRLRIVDSAGSTQLIIPPAALENGAQIAERKVDHDRLTLVFQKGATDPTLYLSDAAIHDLNSVTAAPP